MKRIPQDLLARMANSVSAEDRDEMAIPSYLHGNPVMRWIAWRRLDVVAKFLRQFERTTNNASKITIMDFGCGTGVLFDEACRIADRIYGVDLVLEPARLLIDEWGLNKVSLLHADDAKTRIAPQSVDTIIAAEVLEHIEDIGDTLAFFRSRLKVGGRLLVSLPTENLLYRFGRRLAGFHGHYHESNAASIHQQILGAGFRQLRMQKIPAPGPLAIYWVTAYALDQPNQCRRS
ncbi:MAG: class I SAM-dependent methyltransferase [Gammaproteobacteria bacterium]|nr:class I SAM-dependent methyltransferase [Gammaproteobacteria bacterium]